MRSDQVAMATIASVTIAVVMLFVYLTVTAVSENNVQKSVEETRLHEQAETERTEERAQFWQKLVPWGKDEDEASTE